MSLSQNLRLQVLLKAIDNATRPMRGVSNESRALSQALKESRQRLKELNAQQGQIDAFRTISRDAAIAGNTLKQAQARVRQLKEEMARTENPTKAMARTLDEASRAARDLKTRHGELQAKQQALRSSLAGAGIDTKQLASHQRTLKQEVEATTRAVTQQSSALAAAKEQARQMQAARSTRDRMLGTRDKLAGYGAGMTAAGTVTTAAAAAPVAAYAQAEDAATQLRIAMMQSNGSVSKDFELINDLAVQLGNRLPGTTADFQNMMTMLIRQGMSSKVILGGLGEAAALLAVQLKMAPTEAAEFASKLQDATRTADKDMTALMDTIQKSFYLGVDQGNMLQGFSKLSPALSILRKEGAAAAKELAPLLVMADQAGMAGEAAGNAYRKVFQQAMAVDKVKKANAALAGTGIKLNYSDGRGEFGGLEQLFAQLAQLKTVNTEKRLKALKEGFGDDAETLQVLTTMIEKGLDGYREVQAKMQAQADLQKRVNEQLGTLKNLWDAASGTFTNALAAFGAAVAPELKGLVNWLGAGAEGLQGFAKEHPVLAGVMLKTVGIFGMLLVILGGLALAAATVMGPFAALQFGMTALGIKGVTVLGMLGNALKFIGWIGAAVGRALLLNPIGLIITGIAVSAYLIYSYWGPVSGFFSTLWGGITRGVSTAWTWITGVVTAGRDALSNLFLNWTLPGLIIQHWDTIVGFVASLPQRFMAMGGQIIDGLIGGITSRFSGLQAAVAGIGDSVVGWFKEKLGIHSPSRVFAELGGFTMQGLQIGLNDKADGPLDAMKGIAKGLAAAGAGVAISAQAAVPDMVDVRTQVDTRPPAAAAPMQGQPGSAAAVAPSAPGVSDRIEIHVHSAPGMDEDALARLVMQKLEELQRQRQVAGRSRTRDWD